MSAIKAMIGSAIGNAVGFAVVWLVVNNLHKINGVGLLERQGWPFDSVITVSVVGAIIGAMLGLARHKKGQVHHAAVAALSDEIAFQFDDEARQAALPSIPLFKDLGGIENRMSGTHHGVPIEVFDLTTIVKSDEGNSERKRTVVLLPAEGLPPFQLNAKSWGYRFLDWIGVKGITFDAAQAATPEDRETIEAFQQSYHLVAQDVSSMAAGEIEVSEAFVAAVRSRFSLAVLAAFADRPGWSVESADGYLAMWQGNGVMPADARLGLLASAVILRDALMTPADPARLPPAPSENVQAQQTARFQGALLGGVLGCFGGFFAGGAIMSYFFFQWQPGGRPPFLEFIAIPVCAVLGALTGIRIGSRVIKSPLRKPKNKSQERLVGCAILFGFFGGFMGGGILGGILGEVLNLGMGNGLRPLIFFGGAALGLVLGPLTMGSLAYLLVRNRESGERPASETGERPA